MVVDRRSALETVKIRRLVYDYFYDEKPYGQVFIMKTVDFVGLRLRQYLLILFNIFTNFRLVPITVPQ